MLHTTLFISSPPSKYDGSVTCVFNKDEVFLNVFSLTITLSYTIQQ